MIVAAFAAILFIVGISLVVASRQAQMLERQSDIAHELELVIRDLSYLFNDYLLNGEKVQRSRWETRFETFSHILEDFSPEDAKLAALIEEIKVNREHLQTIFGNVASTLEDYPSDAVDDEYISMIRTSWSRMEVQSQGIAFNTSQVAWTLEQKANRLQQRTILLLFALIGIFGAFLVINYITVNRRILMALADLQSSTKIIGSGNLQFTIEEKRNDEIGDLSRAFNRMTSDLRAVTASKADLEQEINERKRIEQALKRSNEDLAQFASVASHDLQEPLRAIVGFLQILQNKYGDRLDEKGGEYIKRTVDAGQRMQEMIRELLDLSRVSTKGANFAPTDLGEIMQIVMEDLQAIIREKNVEIHYADLPVLEVDAGQIQRLFQNLIVNAVKYNTSPKPVIEIDSAVNGDTCRFAFRDNGIGISAEFHQRIFTVFQRLHKHDEYSGSGMGLALCKKIVERHGGTIWVESQPDEGSTFYFTLPLKK